MVRCVSCAVRCVLLLVCCRLSAASADCCRFSLSAESTFWCNSPAHGFCNSTPLKSTLSLTDRAITGLSLPQVRHVTGSAARLFVHDAYRASDCTGHLLACAAARFSALVCRYAHVHTSGGRTPAMQCIMHEGQRNHAASLSCLSQLLFAVQVC